MALSDAIRKVRPYVPGEQPREGGVIKLNTNENPYPPSPEVAKVLAGFDPDTLRLYPDPAASVLVQAIADRYGVSPGEVFVGVGSDDVLALSFLTFFNSGKPLLFPDVTYSFYEVWAELFRIPYEALPLDEAFRLVPEDYIRENGGIIFPNPNAPTGRLLPIDAVRRIAEANRESVVIVDEAYIDFGGVSALPLIREFDNLLVVQTFSKSRSAAGLRIGYAMGNRELIRCLEDVKYSFNSYTMNRLTIEAGAAALRDEAYFKASVSRIVKTREETKAALGALGFNVIDSSANFVFASHSEAAAEDLFRYLKSEKIYVRWWDRPRIRNFLRITIGTDEEMDALLAALARRLCR